MRVCSHCSGLEQTANSVSLHSFLLLSRFFFDEATGTMCGGGGGAECSSARVFKPDGLGADCCAISRPRKGGLKGYRVLKASTTIYRWTPYKTVPVQ